jgi:CheY-like chemotaxis protein
LGKGVEAKGGPTVLLVENSSDTRLALVMGLQTYGYRTIVATNGEEALDVLELKTCDVILADLQMPVTDGRQFVAALRAAPAAIRVPLVLMTALPDYLVRHLDVDAILRKPFTFDAMVRELAAALSVPTAATHAGFMPGR